MAEKTLSLKIEGSDKQNGEVAFSDFKAFCDRLSACLRKTERAAFGTEEAKYYVADLKHGSTEIVLSPFPDMPGAGIVFDAFVNYVEIFEAGAAAAGIIASDLLNAFRDLFVIVTNRKRVKGVYVNDKLVTSQVIATIDKLLGDLHLSQGSVSGMLERVNVHNRNEFVIYPPIPGYTIKCEFEPALLEEVKRAIGTHVTVFGEMSTRPDMPFPEKVRVASIEQKPDDAELPTLLDLLGLSSADESTNGLSATDFLRKVRYGD